jgi:CHAT domain-containing protein
MRRRVHWCPTGAFVFVPVHAAGIYQGRGKECCSDYMVSSYAPTLTSLLRAQRNPKTYTSEQIQIATIPVEQAHNTDLPLLRHVPREADLIIEIAAHAGASTSVMARATSKQDVIAALQTANVVHLACHGVQQDTEPHQSHFCLSDGTLSVAEVMEIDLKHAFFAFLSACETAKGARQHADEVVHLAATMLFAGFKSVVATMW